MQLVITHKFILEMVICTKESKYCAQKRKGNNFRNTPTSQYHDMFRSEYGQ
jgi:hypothetical protein